MIFIQSLLNGDFQTLRFKLGVVAIMWLLVAVAMVIDLVSGVQKARQRGELRTSYGFKQTVNKAVIYYAFMLFSFMFDCIGTFFYPLPFVTLVAAAFLIFIEGKSVLEKASEKDKRKLNRNLTDLSVLLENREDILKSLTELLKKKLEESNGSKENES